MITRFRVPQWTPEQLAAMDRNAAAWAAEKRRDAQEKLRRYLRELPLRAETIDAIVADTLAPTKALEFTRRWLAREDVPPILVLSGTPGTGKSTAAAWAVAQAFASEKAHWVGARDVARIFTATFGDEVREQRKLVRGRMLVVDDVAVEMNAAAMGSALLEIVDRRQRSAASMRTIIATNLDKPGFEARYPDARLASRMAQSSAWVTCTGVDLRRAKKN